MVKTPSCFFCWYLVWERGEGGRTKHCMHSFFGHQISSGDVQRMKSNEGCVIVLCSNAMWGEVATVADSTQNGYLQGSAYNVMLHGCAKQTQLKLHHDSSALIWPMMVLHN